MSQSLADLMPGAGTPVGIRLWLKSSAYTRRLLLGASGDPWGSASQYLAYFSQAHGLLKPDVAVLEVGELFDSWLIRNPGLRAELGGKRKLSYPLRKLLEEQGPRELLAEVVMALVAHLRGQVPLVLALPSPLRWLEQASREAGRVDVTFDAGDVEDAAMYVADLIRTVSHFEVGGVLMEEDASSGGAEPVDLELYRPLINVAKHYRWPVAIRLGESGCVVNAALSDIEVFIGKAETLSAGVAQGIDVSSGLWAGEALPELLNGQFYFVEIPREQMPERVLECIGRLRG